MKYLIHYTGVLIGFLALFFCFIRVHFIGLNLMYLSEGMKRW